MLRRHLCRLPLGLSTLGLCALSACSGEPDLSARVSAAEGALGKVALALSVTGDDGEALELRQGSTEVSCSARRGDGSWTELDDVRLELGGPHLIDVVVVADNSGSEDGYLDLVADSVRHHARQLMTGAQRDRIGLVRVSTEARVLLELSEDRDALDAALGEMFVTNGWTALWDGIRLGHEVLERGVVAADSTLEPHEASETELCLDRSHRAVVVFTDGADNNSADEHDTRYPGDGIDTTMADLQNLEIGGVRVPVHAIGVGDDVDAESLTELAEGSGGTYRSIHHVESLHGALESTAATLRTEVPLCFSLPGCEFDRVRALIEVDHRGRTRTAEVEFDLPGGYCD